MPETDTRKKDYNLRAHGGKNLPATTKRKEGKGSQTTTSHSSTRGAMLPQGASGGAAIADVSTTSSASETSVLDVSGPPAPAPPVTVVTPDVSGPPAPPVTVVTPELQSWKEFLLYPPLKKNADYKKKTVFLCLYFVTVVDSGPLRNPS